MDKTLFYKFIVQNVLNKHGRESKMIAIRRQAQLVLLYALLIEAHR